MIYCFDVYPPKRGNIEKNIEKMRKRLEPHGFKERTNQYGSYFYLEVDGFDNWTAIRAIKKYGYQYRKYEKKWERSSNYRSEYFKHNCGPYRCVYCGKRIKSHDIEVDHLIPVGKVKTSRWARFLLYINGIGNVNNYKNLVSSCHKCNQKKSDKMGLWVIRGCLGRFTIVWIIWDILRIIILFGILYFFLINLDTIINFLNTL